MFPTVKISWSNFFKIHNYQIFRFRDGYGVMGVILDGRFCNLSSNPERIFSVFKVAQKPQGKVWIYLKGKYRADWDF